MEHFTHITESVLDEILRSRWGYDSFRYPQKEVILDLICGTNTLAIMPTGLGKSLCFQILALLGRGLILVVTPLIALMDDQVEQARSKGIRAACLHSSLLRQDQKLVIQRLHNKTLDLLFISPERLGLKSFLSIISTLDLSLFVVDEAHCISQWGYDFRPSYMEMHLFLNQRKTISVLALTATAPKHVQRDIRKQLQIKKSSVYQTSLYRQNLQIQVQYALDKIDFLVEMLGSNQSSIIYLRHRRYVELICVELGKRGVKALPYHAGLDRSIRKQNQSRWMKDNANCMVATNAFGMGINKPNVRYVFHYKPPSSIEDYIQEIGRAGRDGEESKCILLYNHKDLNALSAKIRDYSIFSIEAVDRTRKKSMRRMLGLITRDICRFRYALDYFDENLKIDCGKCDVCNNRIKDNHTKTKHLLKDFLGDIHIDQFIRQYPTKDHDKILKAVNNLINEGRIKLKGAYLEWNKTYGNKS